MHFGYSILLVDLDVLKNKIGSAIIWAGGSTTINFSITSGTSFKWQQNTGNGFIELIDNANLIDTSTSLLQLKNIPASWNAYKYP